MPATDSGAIGVAPNGTQPDCAELAACCPLTGELRATCEISVQVNDEFNCGATDPSDAGNDAGT